MFSCSGVLRESFRPARREEDGRTHMHSHACVAILVKLNLRKLEHLENDKYECYRDPSLMRSGFTRRVTTELN